MAFSSRTSKFALSNGKTVQKAKNTILPQISHNLNQSPKENSYLLTDRNLSVPKFKFDSSPNRNKKDRYYAELKRLENGEKNWDTHFHLMWSKDNELVTKSKRELFDLPLLYNIDGTKL